MNISKYSVFLNLIIFFINAILYFLVLKNLDVDKFYLSVFYLSSFFLIFYTFNYKTIYFEKFLSAFIWLGFPFKLAIPYVAIIFGFEIKLFPEVSSNINFSKDVYNDAIAFSTFGIVGFIFASILRKNYIFFYPKTNRVIKNNLKLFYEKYKIKIILFYLLAIFLITFSNLYFEIYQKGIYSEFSIKLVVPLFKWFLLMGLSSFACYFVYYDLVDNKNFTSSSVVLLLESFFSNISILSRAFIFNIAILFIILFDQLKKILRTKFPILLCLAIFSLVLFFLNINISSKLRSCVNNYSDINKNEKIFFSKKCMGINDIISEQKSLITIKKLSSLSVARWVGIDSMMAIMNNKNELNLKYYLYFLNEKKLLNEKSYYEKHFLYNKKIEARIINTNHLILPGYISYQSISGSKFFVFLSCFFLGILGAYLEKFTYAYSYNNFVISAFISYLFVFRIIHFGYIPSNTLIYCLSIIFTFLQFRVYEFILGKINIVKKK